MAILINNAGVQHYANKMCDANNRKVGSKSLPTALSDIDNLIDEMKTRFDAEYGSALDMKLENNENIFIVGTGTDIDKRSEVENSFTNVELSGNSLVNLYPKPKRENYGNITGGVSFNGEKINIRANGTYQNIFLKKGILNLKPSTTYTLIINISKNTLVGSDSGSLFVANTGSSDLSAFSNGSTLSLNALGIYKQILTTRSSFEDVVYDTRCFVKMDCTAGEIEFTYILLEGDWTNKPIPQYFEGLKSIGEKEDGNHKISISSMGKNLCPYNNAEFQANEIRPWIDMLGVEEIHGGSNVANKTRTWFYLSEGKYKLAYKAEKCNIQVIDKNENILNFNNNFKGGYVCIRIKSNTTSGTYSVKDLQIELSETQTHYEPYKEDKKEILLNEPLRGLPNGVKDTIEKVNGEWKIIRRCVEVVLNGTENWRHENPSQEDGVNTVLFTTNDFLTVKDFPKLCDRFIAKNHNLMLSTHPDSEGVGCWTAKKNVNIRINKSRLSTVDVDGFKQWLSENPTKIIYELLTPVVEDIDPITLQCWKNGTISIDEVLPTETTHTVALNKPAQIKRNIEELTTLRKRVEALEDFYDKVTLEQSHQLNLVNHSFELDYNI